MTPRTVIDTFVHIFVALIYDVIAQSTLMVSNRFCIVWYICLQYSICGRQSIRYTFLILRYFYSNEIYFLCMSYFANYLSWLWAILNLVLVISTLACLVSCGEGIIITRSNESWWFSNFQTVLFSSLHISQIDDWQISKQVHEVHQCIAHHTRVVILLILTIRHFGTY